VFVDIAVPTTESDTVVPAAGSSPMSLCRCRHRAARAALFCPAVSWPAGIRPWRAPGEVAARRRVAPSH